MNSSKRIVVWGVALLALLLVVVGLILPPLLDTAAQRAIRRMTGLDLRVERIETSLWKPTLRIVGLTVRNPKGFPEGEALRIDEFYAEYDRASLFGDEIHFREVRLSLPHMTVVETAEGRNNFQEISDEMRRRREAAAAPEGPPVAVPESAPAGRSPAPSAPSPSGPPDPPAPGAPSGPVASAPASIPVRPYRIDRMTIKFGRVEMRDYGAGAKEPDVRAIDLNVEHTVQDVTDLEKAGQELALMLAIKSAPTLLEKAAKEIQRLKGTPEGEQIDQQLKELKKAWDKFRKGG